MTTISTNDIEIACEISGSDDGDPLLLIHGVGAQLVRWPPAHFFAWSIFC